MQVDLRPYHATDLYQYYRICLLTGASGEDATGTIEDELLGHFFVAPYCQHDPGLCFTLTVDGVPSGYIVGTADTKAFVDWCEAEWWPSLRERYSDVDDPGLSDYSRTMVQAIHEGETAPAFADAYPAHLHINILPIAQGGNGTRMMDRFMDALRHRGVSAVHLGLSARNERAHHFYQKYGMHEISRDGSIYMGLNL